MSKLEGIMPLFIVSELQRSIAFYRDRLGFELRVILPEEEPFFAIVGRDGVALMLKQVGPEVSPQPNPSRHEWARWDAFVAAPDPDGLAAELVSRSPERSLQVADSDDGLRGFELADPDGYVLYFGHPREA